MSAARSSLPDPHAAARTAAMLRSAIAGNAGAAFGAHAPLDPHRVVALLD